MIKLIKIIVLSLLIIFCCALPAFAQELTGTDADALLNEEFFYPDWNSLTFSHFGVLEEGGSLDLGSYSGQFGYDISRSWQAGDSISNILLLGDFGSISNLPSWTLKSVFDNMIGADFSLEGLSLSDFVLASEQSLLHLVNNVPLLGGYKLKDITPFYDLVSSTLFSQLGSESGLQVLKFFENRTLAQFPWEMSLPGFTFNFGALSLGQLDLTKYEFTSIPNLEQVRFSNFIGWQKTPLGEIPGLNLVPLAKFLSGLNKLGFLARVDVAYGEKEARRTNTITGSYEEGFAVPCNQPNCAHLELTDVIDGLRIVHGKQWISGKSQQVKGGWGFLKWVNGGKEPTGRHPFGEAFKVVLTDVNESTGTGKFGIYFRVCVDTPLMSGCTPYFIGPVPWFNQKEKSIMFIGFDKSLNNGEELSNEQIEEILKSYPELPLPPDIPDFLEDILSKDRDNQYSGDGDCQTYKGVHIAALKSAFSFFESSSDYTAVGKYHQCVGCIPPRYGHALGKYQISSYREDLEAIIKSKPGGVQFWNDLSSGKYAQAKHLVKSQVLTFFSVEEQEELVTSVLKGLIDKYYAQGLRGNKLLTAVASEYSAKASYSWKLAAKYNEKLNSAQQKCSSKPSSDEGGSPPTMTSCQGTINLIKPTAGTKTSGYGWRNGRMHNGIDVANAVGTPIKAAADGQVVDTVTTCHPTQRNDKCGGGYGNRIYVKHCNGWVTRYAHLSKLNVKNNSFVKGGTTIAEMGNSGSTTGPHLHFEIRVNNGTTAVNPEKYINF